jgi:glucokinase
MSSTLRVELAWVSSVVPIPSLRGDAGARVIAIDVGGSSIKGALVGADAGFLRTRRALTPQISEETLVDSVVSMACRLADESARDGRPAVALGICVAGVVDEASGMVHRGANLVWGETPLRRVLEERVGVPTVLLQDARAAALAESVLGAGRGGDDFILVILGTGVGSAVVINGRPLRGAHGVAGEIGHLRVDAEGMKCGCGGRGCVETLASASAVARRYILASGEALPVERIVEKAMAGDDVAAQVWNEAVGALATALAAAVAVVDCGLVLFGGGMAAAGPALLNPLQAQLAKRLSLAPPPRLALAALGNSAGVLGSAASAFARVGQNHVIQAWRAMESPDGQADAEIRPASVRAWNT